MKKKPLFTIAKSHSGIELSSTGNAVESKEMEVDENVSGTEPLSLPSTGAVDEMSNGCTAAGGNTLLNPVDEMAMKKENWVTAVAALHNTDLVVSGKKWFIS